MQADSRIYVAGHRGLVGSAIVAELRKKDYSRLILKTHSELDLTDQASVRDFYKTAKPEYVFLAAAKVGGILANSTYPADFIYQNLMIETNLIHAAHEAGVKKLLFLGSSCIYPRLANQPMEESELLTGALEPTNEAYAIAKIAGIKMCESYRRQFGSNFFAVMPTNLYGPQDNYDLQSSHVLPALIRKIHEAKASGAQSVEIWGTGKPLREFLFSEDLAEACVYLMEKLNAADFQGLVNIGTGKDITIRELAGLIAEVIGFKGIFHFDSTKPDGTPRKVLNVDKIHKLGWRAKTPLREGIQKSYEWFLNSMNKSNRGKLP